MVKNNQFEVKVNDKNVSIKVLKVNKEISLSSAKFYSQAFEKALDNGLMLRKQVENMLKERGIYDSKIDEESFEDISKQLRDLEVKLRKGVHGNRRMSKDEGKEIALEMRKLRRKLSTIGSDTTDYFTNTVESVAENERLQYLIYACTVYADSGDNYWKSFEAFKDSPETENELISKAMKALIQNESGIELSDRQDSYEDSWLKRMGFMNSKGQLVAKDGKIVDENGRWINEEGRFVNEQGQLVDQFGNLVNEKGDLLEPDTWDVHETTVFTPEVKSP